MRAKLNGNSEVVSAGSPIRLRSGQAIPGRRSDRSPEPEPCPDCKQATLQTSFKDDSRVWSGVGYSRSVATGGGARVATRKRRGGAGADRIGQDLHLRAALSEPENP